MSEYNVEPSRQGMSVYFPPKTYQKYKEECQKRGLKPSRAAHNLVLKQLKKWKREKLYDYRSRTA